jgi:hypothetical protein
MRGGWILSLIKKIKRRSVRKNKREIDTNE